MPDSQPITAGRAVFLSYAREDLDAARRIADALRGFGVEVWFDQSELRGGDAWDDKIHGQIRACALFIALISAHTQARREGYFRREWKLAVERTSDMAEGVPFLVPVVVDDTAESRALVPAEFLRVQWTRLPGGLPTPQFIEQIKRLLAPSTAEVGQGSDLPHHEALGRSVTPKRLASWAWPSIAVAAVGAIAFFATRKPEPSTASPKPVAETKLSPAVPAVNTKSIAVLPFENLSPDKENEFFADGIHEDVLTNLQYVRVLHVVSRTSVMQYRGTTKTIRQIGQELGVAYILEGSVRRAGNKVRVSAQLIDARTDAHVWALKASDRDLTDIFAIQSAIATEIAGALQAALSPEEKKLIARAPTANVAAYDLYLRALSLLTGTVTIDGFTRAETLLQSAVELDPEFAQAWGRLGRVMVEIDIRRRDSTGVRRDKSRRAIDTMERLAPDDPQSWLQLVAYYLTVVDSTRSEAYLQRAAQALPSNGEVVMRLGDVDRHHRRFVEALAQYRKAYGFDRQSPEIRNALLVYLLRVRHYDEAANIDRDDPHSDGSLIARLAFWMRGSTREMETWLAAHPETSTMTRFNWAWISGAAADYVRLGEEIKHREGAGLLSNLAETRMTIALMAMGETARARDEAGKMVAAAKAAGQMPTYLLAINLALLGEKQAALDCMDAYLAGARDRGSEPDLSGAAPGKSVVLAWVGEKEKAVAEIARLLKIPNGGQDLNFVSVHHLRHSPYWKPLQGDPAFEALLNDPKNNAPLF